MTKVCKQCGETKPIECFRKYYGGRKGTYTVCKQCETINSRTKYLEKKQSLSATEQEELDKIHTLYDMQRACGLQPPRSVSGKCTRLTDNLDAMIEKYEKHIPEPSDVPMTWAPYDLKKWLTEPLTEEPDYYLDEVYEDLKAKYMPIKYIDKDTMLPVYDLTYADTFDKVLSRFNEYEDNYYD